ncbi:hypothetical protein Moror_10846 [Moniliophthora roreri MCA 2997]|uniref:Uncharacterized protein n=1 Tax=Moniliophthora roreri (strain MCA 2997) TaxID=1381753 RepID=V2X5A6_MONRO|nr:hypothetical protein Moror_10846 [Moniliophthora roreri MCA 2997]
MEDIGYTKSMLVALWVQTMFYGMNTVLYILCIYVLVQRANKRQFPINKPLIATATLIYLLCTAHVINDFGRAIVAFITYVDRPGGAAAYYDELWIWTSIVREGLYCVNTMVVDTLLVYRLYVVSMGNLKVIIGPTIILLATTASGYRAVWGFSNTHEGQDTYNDDIFHWGVALFSLSLCLNVIVTILIAWYFYRYDQRISSAIGRGHGQRYRQALAIAVESGAFYSVSVLVVLVTYVTKTNGVYIAYDAVAQIMGMNPILIIVRVGLGLSNNNSTFDGTTLNLNTRQNDTVSVEIHRVTDVSVDQGSELVDMSRSSLKLPKHRGPSHGDI